VDAAHNLAVFPQYLNTSSLFNWQQFDLHDTIVPGLRLHQTSPSQCVLAASRSAASAVSDIPRNLGSHSCHHLPLGTAVSATCHHTILLNLLINYSYQSYRATIIKATKKYPQHHPIITKALIWYLYSAISIPTDQLIQAELFLWHSQTKVHYKLLLYHMCKLQPAYHSCFNHQNKIKQKRSN
jgi:hypothetical protein